MENKKCALILAGIFLILISLYSQTKDIDELIEVLQTAEDSKDRCLAIDALADKPQINKVVGPIIKALKNDPKINVQFYAARALGKIGSPEAVPSLIKVIKKSEKRARHVIEATRGALVKIGKTLHYILNYRRYLQYHLSRKKRNNERSRGL